MSAVPPGFVRLMAALCSLHATMAVARVTGTLWLLKTGHSAAWVGLMLALVALTPALLGAPAGAWADRYGLWRPLLWGSCAALVGVVSVWVYPSTYTLALAALGTGAALALAAVAIQREIALLPLVDGTHKQALYSWASLGPAVSNTASPVLAGLLIDHAGFRAGFFLAVLLAPVGLLLLRKRRHVAWPSLKTTPSLLPALDLLRQRPLRMLLLLNVAFAVSWDAHSFVVPVLGHAREFSASTIGLLLGSFSLAVMVVRLFIVRFAGQYSDRSAMRAALALCVAVLFVYPWLPGVLSMAMGSFLLGLALGSVQPTLLAALTDATPRERHGQALGLRMFATNSAGVLMPLGFGFAASFAGPGAPLWLMAVLAALCWPATQATRGNKP